MATDNQLEEIRQRRASVKPFQKNEAPNLYNTALADIDYLLAEIDRLKGELESVSGLARQAAEKEQNQDQSEGRNCTVLPSRARLGKTANRSDYERHNIT